MRRYGIQLLPVDGYAARFLELRGLGFIAGLVLGALFGETWLFWLGLAMVFIGWLAEALGELALLFGAVIPISLFIWVLSSLLAFSSFFPGSLVFCVLAWLLIQDGYTTLNRCQHEYCP